MGYLADQNNWVMALLGGPDGLTSTEVVPPAQEVGAGDAAAWTFDDRDGTATVYAANDASELYRTLAALPAPEGQAAHLSSNGYLVLRYLTSEGASADEVTGRFAGEE